MSNEKDDNVIHSLFAEFHYTDDLGVIKSKLAEYVKTARKEARAQAFKDAIEIASLHREHSGYTLHQHGSESLDCRNAIWRELEAAATTQKGENDADIP